MRIGDGATLEAWLNRPACAHAPEALDALVPASLARYRAVRRAGGTQGPAAPDGWSATRHPPALIRRARALSASPFLCRDGEVVTTLREAILQGQFAKLQPSQRPVWP